MNALLKYVTWRAIPIAGLVAGTVFLVTNLLVSALVLQTGGFLILRYSAALVMGSGVLSRNDATVYIVGVLVHYGLSLLFSLLVAIVVHRWGLIVGIVGGALLGLALYSINLYALTRFFEWFFAIDSVALLLSHILFGAVAGGVYEVLDRYDQPLLSKERA
jgi:hypothetical protein